MSKFPINLCIFFKFVNFNLTHKCTSGARLEKLFCEYAKNIIICPSAQTVPSFAAI